MKPSTNMKNKRRR